MFVTAELVAEEIPVPVAISADAIQTLRDWTVVFGRYGQYFEARPLELGRSDGKMIEVLKEFQQESSMPRVTALPSRLSWVNRERVMIISVRRAPERHAETAQRYEPGQNIMIERILRISIQQRGLVLMAVLGDGYAWHL